MFDTTIDDGQIADALNRAGLEPDECEIRHDYSGRSMYGATCLGVVGNVRAIAKFLVAITSILIEDDEAFGEERALELAGSAQKDSMGLSEIFYFPGWTVVAGVAA